MLAEWEWEQKRPRRFYIGSGGPRRDGSDARGSGLPEPERSAVAGALRRGAKEVLETGHFVHRDDFEGYVRLLGGWLGEPGA